MQIVSLSDIPPIIQMKYSIGSEVDALVVGLGGQLTTINKNGHEIIIDTAELIEYQVTINERR